jgi:hypothetical protein
MNLDIKLKQVLESIYEVAGFDAESVQNLVSKSLNIWLTKVSLEIFSHLSESEKAEFTELNSKLNTDPAGNTQNEMLVFLKKIDPARQKKAIEIYFYEAEEMAGRMLTRFNSNATAEQKEQLSRKLAELKI